MDKAEEAARKAFTEFNITETKVRKSAVTWDKDYAKAILQRVITLAR